MKVRVLEQNPSAHITKKKSRLKIYNGHKLFLNNKDNFEIELFNPRQDSVLCKIKLNGNYISDKGVVLRPGERIFLERFIDSNNKFVFNTYEVEDNDVTNKSIELNGDVVVEFYYETKVSPLGLWNTQGYGNITCGNYYNPFNITFNTTGTITSTLSNNTSYVETGRIEKGNKSNQSFDYTNGNFNFFVSHTVRYKMLPYNDKIITSEDIKFTRNYCHECGCKIKGKWKFCPTCGSEI